MDTDGHGPAGPYLLVRRAAPAAERHVANLLRGIVDGQGGELTRLMHEGSVFVLSDITELPSAPPVAAVAFRLDRAGRTGELAGIGVRPAVRRRGLALRLLTSALTLLRAEGFAEVSAPAPDGEAAAALLRSAGFTVKPGAAAAGAARVALQL